MRRLPGGWLLLLAGTLAGQTFNNQTLNGRYYFRHLQFTTDSGGTITDIRSLSGTLNFTGTGNFSFNGQQTAGTNPPVALAGNGTYSVDPAGIVTLNNPQNTSLAINARYGSAGSQEAMLVGSTTLSNGPNVRPFCRDTGRSFGYFKRIAQRRLLRFDPGFSLRPVRAGSKHTLPAAGERARHVFGD